MLTLRNMIDQCAEMARKMPHCLDKTLKAETGGHYLDVTGLGMCETGSCIMLSEEKPRAIFEEDSEEVREADPDVLAEG